MSRCRRLPLEIRLRAEPGRGYLYSVAGTKVVSDVRLPALEALWIDTLALGRAPRENIDASRPRLSTYRGQAFVAGSWCEVAAWHRPGSYVLGVEGLGEEWILFVSDDRLCLTCVETTRPRALDALLEAMLLGPALSLALAVQDIFCLHASAVEIDGRACAFAAPSGTGKSTLAATWPANRMADDILPVSRGSRGVEALPRYPQPKLSMIEQQPLSKPEAFALEHVFLLAPSDSDPHLSGIRQSAVVGAAALSALLTHSVGWRLFAAELQERHLSFLCEALATGLRVWRLEYAKRFETLPKLRRVISQLVVCQAQNEGSARPSSPWSALRLLDIDTPMPTSTRLDHDDESSSRTPHFGRDRLLATADRRSSRCDLAASPPAAASAAAALG